MSTGLVLSEPSSASRSIGQVAKVKQNDKGKEKVEEKRKGKYRVEEKTDAEGSESEASVAEPLAKSKKKRREGEGLEEVDSDASFATDEDNKEDEELIESDLSSHVDSDSGENSNEDERSVRRKENHATKQGRHAERDAEDKRQVAVTANEGFSNYTRERGNRKNSEKRPELVEKEWRGLYPLLRHMWTPGGKAKLSGPRMEIFKRANEKIERYCNQTMNVDVEFNTKATALYLVRLEKLEKELAGQSESEKVLRRKQLHHRCIKETGQPSKEELLKMWKFPTEELCAQIYSVEKALMELDKMPSEVALKKKIADYDQRLTGCQPGSKELVDLTTKKAKFEKLLAARKKKTLKLLQTALIFLDNLQKKGIPPTQVLSNRAETVFQNFVLMSQENLQLYNALKEEMERPTLEQLDKWDMATKPMYEFVECVSDESMVTEQAIVRADSLVKDLRNINRSIGTLAQKTPAVNRLPTSLLKEILGQYKEGNYEQLKINITRLMEQLCQQEAAAGMVRALELRQPPGASANDSEDTDGPELHSAAADPPVESAAKPPAKAAADMAAETLTNHVTGTNLSEGMLRNLDINSLKLGASVAKIFQYDDGMTEHGPLVATRPSSTDNARLNRYFVNAGLNVPGMEYLKVLKGSDLAPGGAEKLSEQKVVDFNLKQTKKDIKGDHPILSIGPVVMMPRSEGYVPRGTKERRQDAYIKVVYKDKPNPDMLCRTEFTQLCGQKFGGRQFSAMEAAYKQRQMYFEACKVQKLHPQTQKPLTPDDLRKTPWLFPENERDDPENDSSNSIKEEDDPDESYFDGVEIDSGDLPANMIGTFQKPRADLADLAKASSSSGSL